MDPTVEYSLDTRCIPGIVLGTKDTEMKDTASWAKGW